MSQPQLQGPQRPDELTVDLRQLVSIVRGQSWLAVTIIAVCFALSALYAWRLAPQYTASALLQVDNTSSPLSELAGLSGFARNSAAPASVVQTALIKSEFIMKPTVEKLHLDISVSPKYFPIIGARLASLYHGDLLAHPWLGLTQYAWGGESLMISQMQVPLKYANKPLLLTAGSQHTYTLKNSEGEELLHGVTGQQVSAANKRVGQLSLTVDELYARPGTEFYVTKVPADLVAVGLADQVKIEDMGGEGKTNTGVLRMSMTDTSPASLPLLLNTIADNAVEKNIEKKSEQASTALKFLQQQLPLLSKGVESSEQHLSEYWANHGSFDMSTAGTIMLSQATSIEQRLEALELQKKEALQQFKPDHPIIHSLNMQEQVVRQEMLAMKDKIRQMPLNEQKAFGIMRDSKVKAKLYDMVLDQIQSLEISKATTLSDLSILNYAVEPINPLPSKRVMIMLAGLILGVLMALGAVLVRWILTRSDVSPDELEKKLGIPLFSIIPYSDTQADLAAALENKLPRESGYILAKVKPKDISIEGLKSLRTTLQFSLHEKSNNTICVIGSRPNIGKSFISLNLAYVMADSGKKVLLIDGDLRKGKLCQFLQTEKAPGMAEYLAGEIRHANVVRHVSANIDFISTGLFPENPSELLAGQRLQQMLDDVKKNYDLVILDAPPVLAVTDGMLLAQYAGTTLFVVGGGRENYKELQIATDKFVKNNIHITGLIYNMSSRNAASLDGYGYGYGYGYNYYYDYNDEEVPTKSLKSKLNLS